jgi:hypothetical protein
MTIPEKIRARSPSHHQEYNHRRSEY